MINGRLAKSTKIWILLTILMIINVTQFDHGIVSTDSKNKQCTPMSKEEIEKIQPITTKINYILYQLDNIQSKKLKKGRIKLDLPNRETAEEIKNLKEHFIPMKTEGAKKITISSMESLYDNILLRTSKFQLEQDEGKLIPAYILQQMQKESCGPGTILYKMCQILNLSLETDEANFNYFDQSKWPAVKQHLKNTLNAIMKNTLLPGPMSQNGLAEDLGNIVKATNLLVCDLDKYNNNFIVNVDQIDIFRIQLNNIIAEIFIDPKKPDKKTNKIAEKYKISLNKLMKICIERKFSYKKTLRLISLNINNTLQATISSIKDTFKCVNNIPIPSIKTFEDKNDEAPKNNPMINQSNVMSKKKKQSSIATVIIILAIIITTTGYYTFSVYLPKKKMKENEIDNYAKLQYHTNVDSKNNSAAA